MWIYFDLQTIATTRVFDTPIRQGDIGDELFVRFEAYPNTFVGKFVTLQIEYPNGLLSPEVYMELGFSKLFTLPTQGDFTNGVTYYGVRYIFNDPIWFQQFGLHKITIRVYTGAGGQPSAIETSGLFSFNVEKSVFNPEAPITIAQYQYLLSLINATQLNIDNVVVVVDVLPNLNDLGPLGFLYDKRWFVVRGVSPVQLGTLFYIDGNQAVQVELGVNTLQIQGQAGNEGQLKWNADKGSIELILQNNVTTFLNKATMFYCKANEVIAIGDVCEFVSYQGDHIIIRKARPSSINANSSLVMGLAANAMGINGFGYVTAFGEIFNIPTRGLSQGSFIWFDSANVNFGEWTSTPPTAPNAKVLCGVVTVASSNPSSTNGKVLVRLVYEPRLGELQDVNISGVTAGQVVARNSTNTRWENKTLTPGDIGAQPVGTYATLDGTGKVPAAQLPSYVDDVLEFANLASFPVTGETGKIYIAINTPPTTKSRTYRWSGSVYVEINPQEIQTAVQTPFVPFGPIGSSDVQNAIQELFNESSFITANEYSVGYVEVSFGSNVFSGYSFSNHIHGHISNAGVSTSTITPIQTGDAIMIADNSDSQKIKRGVEFNTTTPFAGFFLNEDGTFKRPTHIETLFASVSLVSGSNGAGATPALGSLLLFDYVVLEIEQEFQQSGETLMTRIEIPQNRFYNGLQGGKAGAWLTTPNYFVPGGYLTVAIYPNNLTTLDIDLLYQGGSNTQFWRVNVLGGNYV